MKSEVKEKDQQLTDVRKTTERLQEEREKVSDIIRQEFADRWDNNHNDKSWLDLIPIPDLCP